MRIVLTSLMLLAAAYPSAGQSAWQLVWSDEFNGPARSLPDPSKWTYDLGAGGWGNNELETYTASADNASLDGNGNLVIHALETSPSVYTSARLKTQGLFTTTYGKIEARIKIPFGQGLWPAFWMLGANIDSVGWPACGEIDIMENIGSEPSTNHGTVHGPGYSGPNGITAAYNLPNGEKLSDDFHIFSVIWTPLAVEFSVDGNSYSTVSQSSIPSGTQWVFNHPFFLLLNVAVGGDFPGSPGPATQFPQTMTVDYVRVYQAAAAPVVNVGGIVNAASFGSAMAPGGLATLFGTALADTTIPNLFDATHNVFPHLAGGASVRVNGVSSPMTYVSPGQINFQIPWETPVGKPVLVEVSRDGITSNSQSIAFTATAPSAFAANGVAILNCTDETPKVCTLWGNGFGPKQTPQHDGTPSAATPLPWTATACALAVGDVAAKTTYCGAAPGLIIDQLNFDFPAGVSASGSAVQATLTIGGASAHIELPAMP